MEIVKSPQIGDKVVRGRDWDYGDQDRNSIYGKVIGFDTGKKGWCRVDWVSSNGSVLDSNCYRYGTDGPCDLYYYKESKFSVGDTVVGNEMASKMYGTTVEGWIGKVVKLLDDGFIKVEDAKGTNYSVEGGCFDLVPEKSEKVHPKYDTFERGDTVRRWRNVEVWEWEGIGELDELPPLGEDVEVESIDIDNDHKEDSFYIRRYGWIPMKAFVLAEYYQTTITTNRGTAALNTTDHGKSKIAGSSIEVQRSSPSIISGKRTSRSGVQSRGNATIVRGGYSRHEAITSK
jgi:hypothetical protein